MRRFRLPVPTWWLITAHNSSGRAPKALFQPPRAPHMYVVQIYTCRENTQTHKIKESKNKKKYKETGKMHLEHHTQQ